MENGIGANLTQFMLPEDPNDVLGPTVLDGLWVLIISCIWDLASKLSLSNVARSSSSSSSFIGFSVIT